MGREIGSILCDTLKKVAFSDGLGGVSVDEQTSPNLGEELSCSAAWI